MLGNDKYWMDIGGDEIIGRRRFLALSKIRGVDTSHPVYLLHGGGQSAKKISSEYTDSTTVSDNFCSGNTRVHLSLRSSIGYVMDAFTISPFTHSY